jgi:hypothetical protein
MVVGHQHLYSTGTDAATQIPYLITGDANGDANSGNPGFSLVRVNNGKITQQHMLADNLNLAINYTANAPALAQGKATITCSGYSLPFVRLKFKLSNTHAAYQAKDLATGASIPTYSHQFPDYTVVYVETDISNGATKNIQVDPVTTARTQTGTNSNVITVTPNTARDFVTINLPAAGTPYHIVLYDIQGKPVKEVKTASSAVIIRLDGLTHGTYVAKIYAGSKYITTKKIVVAE